MYMLGYPAKEDRVFLIDNAFNVVSFRVLLSVLQFQTAIVRQDMDEANLLIKYVAVQQMFIFPFSLCVTLYLPC